MRRAIRLGVLATLVALVSGHVGSRDAIYRGKAGPYSLRITVRAPVVVPGKARISVRAETEGAQEITVQAIRWDVGSAGSPAAQAAQPVGEAGDHFSADLWLMTVGSHAIRVMARGNKGTGAILVPVMALPHQRLPLSPFRTVMSAALLTLLVSAAATLAASGTRDATLQPGLEPGVAQRAIGRRTGWTTAIVLVVLLSSGAGWWAQLDSVYRRALYQSPVLSTSVRTREGVPHLAVELQLDRYRGRARERLIPDHGKLMHLFMVREPDLRIFLHLHPVPTTGNQFSALLPRLPAGSYRLYGDIVHADGFAETAVGRVEIGEVVEAATAAFLPADPDDSCVCENEGLEDGTILQWQRPRSLVPGEETELRFAVFPPSGEALDLEPYMGMVGHAVVSSYDGEVFAHLHPGGTVSMAAQEVLMEDRRAYSATDAVHQSGAGRPAKSALTSEGENGTISFPWIFPTAGEYRMWVQLKRKGRVLTGWFDVVVPRGSSNEGGPGS